MTGIHYLPTLIALHPVLTLGGFGRELSKMAVEWRRNFTQNLGTGLAFDYGSKVVSVQGLPLNSFPWPGIGSLFNRLEPWFGGISLV